MPGVRETARLRGYASGRGDRADALRNETHRHDTFGAIPPRNAPLGPETASKLGRMYNR